MPSAPKPPLLKLIILAALDLAGVSSGFFVAYFINFGGPSQNFIVALGTIGVYWKIFLFNSFLWLLIFNLFGLYQLEKRERLVKLGLILLGTTLGMLVSLTATFIYPEFTYAKSILLVAWLLASALTWLLRNIYLGIFLK